MNGLDWCLWLHGKPRPVVGAAVIREVFQKRLDKRREHVCRITLTYCLDEERFERCTNIDQGLVVSEEQATRIGC